MSEAIVAGKLPMQMELEPGEYWWCACGRAKIQPFCDGSHAGSGIEPMPFTVAEKGRYWLCTCKQTQTPPYCDGSHDLLD